MRKKILGICMGAAILATGCQTAQQPKETAVQAAQETEAANEEMAAETEESIVLAEIEDGAVPLYSKPQGSYVRVPVALGTSTYGNSSVTVDGSNTAEGYIMVKYTGSNGKIKVQITKSGGNTYTYDLNARSSYEVFPLTDGNGTYSVKVFENISGNQYAQAFSQDISVSLSNPYIPFLYPNQYVNFNPNSAAVATGAQVAAGATDQLGVVTAVYNYVIKNITYDVAKANSVTSGYLPNVDSVLAARTGICFDYAALMTAMLRSQDIPTKLVVGYTGNLYHAWINVYLENEGWVDNIIYFDGKDWKLMDPTFASSGNQSAEIMQYIGNGANYQAKYSY